MSARKRLRSIYIAKSNPNPETVDVSNSDDDNCIINTFPNEVIRHILSKLSHGDLLWSRLVCMRWNEIVTSDPNFLRRSIIRICGNSENGKNRDNIFMNSIVKWKHLYLKDLQSFANRRTFPVEVPFYLCNEIQTLKISTSKLSWKGFQLILVQFPCLRELKTSHLEILGSSKERKKSVPKTSLQYEFEAVLNGLTCLQISRCDIRATNLLLIRFHNHLKTLSTFVVKDYFSTALSRRYAADFCEGLFELLEGTSGTLRTFGIFIREAQIVKNLFAKVIRRLNESPTASSSLNLTNISIRFHSFFAEVRQTSIDQEILLQFLKMNKNVKTISCLPKKPRSRTDMIRKFMAVLPQDIVQIEVPNESYFSAPVRGSFFSLFDKLKAVRIHDNVSLHRLRFRRHNVMPGVETFGTVHIRGLNDIQLVSYAFPNLVHLQLVIADRRMSTNIVHHICGHIKLLVSLDLKFKGRCRLTDFSVTGITALYCTYLQGFSGKTLNAIQIPNSKRPRNPLGSLFRLEKLVIDCGRILMTDVGLCFGFRFPCLKHFSLSNRGRQTSITLAGLHYIADYNRSLERIMLHGIIPNERSLGWTADCEIDKFKRRLDRCKHFRMTLTH